MTQHDQIINYMKEHGSITPYEAFLSLGITKLATRVSEMRRAGKDIRDVWEEEPELGKRWKRYVLPNLSEDVKRRMYESATKEMV